jgi:hypothetical protein
MVAMSATANAGAAISDKRYWPSEVGPSAYRAVNTQHAPRDAFAAIGRTASPVVASASAEEDTSQPGCWSAPRHGTSPTRGDVRDHIDLNKRNREPSYWS